MNVGCKKKKKKKTWDLLEYSFFCGSNDKVRLNSLNTKERRFTASFPTSFSVTGPSSTKAKEIVATHNPLRRERFKWHHHHHDTFGRTPRGRSAPLTWSSRPLGRRRVGKRTSLILRPRTLTQYTPPATRAASATTTPTTTPAITPPSAPRGRTERLLLSFYR